jgi:cell wall-associated NlpC family hydrolase
MRRGPPPKVTKAEWRALPPELAAQGERLAQVLAAWEGTPYWPGQQARGADGGVDCVRFVAAIVDALKGTTTPIETLPPDAAMHARASAIAAMKKILDQLGPADLVDGPLEPGDVVITGPIDGGPGHAMIVGPQPNTLWESAGSGVHRCGLGSLGRQGTKVHYCYRLRDRERWVT